MDEAMQRLVDEAALRQVAEIYARGADRRDKDLWRSVMAPECIISGPGFCFDGREECLGALDTLTETFRETQHRIFNQTMEIDGDSATGETYCSADHVMKDSDQLWCWAIRYQNRLRREQGKWVFTRRDLVVDWMEMRPLHSMEQGA